MPTSPFTAPTVDITPYLAEGARAHNSAECARVAAELDTACREVGFVQIVGHRIPGATVDRLASALDPASESLSMSLESKPLPGLSSTGRRDIRRSRSRRTSRQGRRLEAGVKPTAALREAARVLSTRWQHQSVGRPPAGDRIESTQEPGRAARARPASRKGFGRIDDTHRTSPAHRIRSRHSS
ncbi:2-oxoglutarate and iron-dependent oxygenase domain-containing protein [Rhodococcus sp. WB9]|uniref:2-oxoglutarate and iron-dependent oxygenase domain-containing protein n=1 Tax=Rhodococcus sp. WB9 TaxID=2594007 RepID=UPI0021B38533|nr:2-oxoglutarate and iron-dependent oxygenase domain-containing protein [Rhodococcus sp. WB9]